MAIEDPVRVDRRHLRRQQTIEEIVDVAVEVMAEDGVAGLSLGEVARRMGMRTPSLYGYFAAKNALYDAVFARGYSRLADHLEAVEAQLGPPTDLQGHLLQVGDAFLRWAYEYRVYAQLMFWRPVPDYEPAPDAYAPSLRLMQLTDGRFEALAEAGLIRPEVDLKEARRVWTVLTSGALSQQLANAPHEPYDEGTFVSTLPRLVDMFVAVYGTKTRRKGRKNHADQR